MFLVTHEQIRSTPRVRVVWDFVAAVLAEHQAELNGGPRPQKG
jgi:hypothetical protein